MERREKQMQELFEKYTDDEILKYYSLLSVEGRTMRRLLHEIMQRVDGINGSTVTLTIKLFRLYYGYKDMP